MCEAPPGSRGSRAEPQLLCSEGGRGGRTRGRAGEATAEAEIGATRPRAKERGSWTGPERGSGASEPRPALLTPRDAALRPQTRERKRFRC